MPCHQLARCSCQQPVRLGTASPPWSWSSGVRLLWNVLFKVAARWRWKLGLMGPTTAIGAEAQFPFDLLMGSALRHHCVIDAR